MGAGAPNLAELFEATAVRHRSRLCLSWEDGGEVSYGELAEAMRRQADLIREAGLSGTRIGLMQGNRPELVLLWLACMRAGATAVFLNPALTAPEVRRIAEDLGLAVLIGEAYLEVGVPQVVLGDAPAASPIPLPLAAPDAAVGDPGSTIVLTSGSTGRPKYVPVPDIAFTLKALLNTTALGWNENDRTYCVMPLFHVGAQSETLAPALVVGGAVHLARSFSASGLWSALEATGTTHFHATGSLLAMALGRAEPVAGGSLRRLVGSLRPDLAAALGAALPGVDLLSLYGLTECPLGTLTALGEPYRRGFVGYPYLPDSVRLVEGEIQLRNPACTQGYIGLDPGEGFTADGWLRTGDLGEERDGGLYLTGRLKEMIRRSGENIAPAEVEEVALQHPAVIEAAAVPFPDPIRDEEVWLLVEVGENSTAPDPSELREFMSAQLAPYKLPRYIDVRSDLPKTGSNKVDKPTLVAGGDPGWDATSA
ncbi:MAG: acyl--CoA ligase [Actinobacteria bacterium]|nr:acyl--CoA ligase [Actinomycetota bacterium]